jgi:hypothetical protein
LHMQSKGNGSHLHEQTTPFASCTSSLTHSQTDSPSPTPTPASGGGASHDEIVKAVEAGARSARPVPVGAAPRPPFRVVAGGAR